jgi:hypothetical protein
LVKRVIIMKRFILVLSAVCILSSAASAKYSGGAGEPNDPYLIATPDDLNSIGLDPNDWDKQFKMIADVNISTISKFNIIGYYAGYYGLEEKPFTGTFDGNDHFISGFTYDACSLLISYPWDRAGTGIFGFVNDPCASIKNTIISAPKVEAKENWYVGALVGVLGQGEIRNCQVRNGFITGLVYVGGLIGFNKGSISNCCCGANIRSSSNYTGGLIGGNFNGSISGSYALGDVNSTGDMIGGLVGFVHEGNISQCFARVTVTGDDSIGGLIGEIFDATIHNCYSANSINGDDRVGGLVGYNRYGVISRCYSTTEVDGTSKLGGLIGSCFFGSYEKCFWNTDICSTINGIGDRSDSNVIGLSTNEMQQRSTFADAG